VVGPSVVVMEQRTPHGPDGADDANDAGRRDQAWSWPRPSVPGIPLTALLGDLGSWKSDRGRETLPPIASRRADLAGATTAADGPTGETADGMTGDAADGPTRGAGDGPTGETDAGTTGDVVNDATGAGETAVAGSLLDWLEVSSAAAQKALGEPTWRHTGAGLSGAMRLLGQLRNAVERLEVAVATEVELQGTANERGLSSVDWLVDAAGAAAPKPDVQHMTRVLNVARAMRGAEPASEVFAEAVRSGAMPLAKADVVSRFVRDVQAVADPEALAADVESLVEAASDNERGRGLTLKELRRAIVFASQLIKPAKDLEGDEQKRRLCRALHKSEGPAGMTTYRLTVDPEGAAIVDAAVSALSAPVKGPDDEADPRSAATRRADALLEVIRRGVSAPGEMPRTEKAQIIVTIPLAHLQAECRGAGLTRSGELLSPAVLRRMACDAAIIPMVLGGRGEVLDIGHGDRLFTPAQRKAVWHRDHQCTFPGCTIPAQWTDVHHVTWWSRGGPTDLSNAALLCGRHHTLVHQRDLSATVTDTGVTWHV